MVSCTPRSLLGPVRRAVQAKAAGTGGATAATGVATAVAARAVRRLARPARVCRDVGGLSLAAAGPTATPAGAPPQPSKAAGKGAEQGSPVPPGQGFAATVPGGGPPGQAGAGPGDAPDPVIPLLPEHLLFGANLPPVPGDPPDGLPTATTPVPEVPYPAQVPEPAALLWLPLALVIVLLLLRRRNAAG